MAHLVMNCQRRQRPLTSVCERLFMIKRKGKLGLGTALYQQFSNGALKHNYNEYIFEMNADFEPQPC